MEKIPVIVVTGATASGKTALAVEIAGLYGGEVISADSMQIYKGMDIATAKPDEKEMRGIKHHLIDFLPVSEKYSVAEFVEDASRAVDDIVSRGLVPVIAGGTGLYIDSLIDGVSFSDEPDNTEIRELLKKRRENEGIEVLYEELKKNDPEAAESIHINNEKRVMRALEVFLLTGETISSRKARSKENGSRYDPVYIGLEYRDRQNLYDRINLRADKMFAAGLVEEAAEYYALENADTASQAIGYKELKGYFDGSLTVEEAAENLKQATRRYAKRQMTWFRRNERINRIYCDEEDSSAAIVARACSFIDENEYFRGRRKEDV